MNSERLKSIKQMGEEVIQRNRAAIRDSAVFIALATKNYVRGVMDPDNEEHDSLVGQIGYARDLGKPAFLVLEEGLTHGEVEGIRRAFQGFKIIGDAWFSRGDEKSMEAAVRRIRESVEDHVRRRLRKQY